MNLILLFPSDFIDGTDMVCLKGRRLKHVLEIHKASVGDRLCVGLCNDRIGAGTITALDKSCLKMKVVLKQKPPKALAITLVLSLPRPLMLKRILFACASMGVKKIILLHSRRVEKSFWQSSELNEERIKEQLVLGLEQARDTVLPEVFMRKRFKPFCDDELPELIKDKQALVAHPGPQSVRPPKIKKETVLLVGPEGGFIDYEIERLIARGCMPITLGERVLRSETAVVALLSKLF